MVDVSVRIQGCNLLNWCRFQLERELIYQLLDDSVKNMEADEYGKGSGSVRIMKTDLLHWKRFYLVPRKHIYLLGIALEPKHLEIWCEKVASDFGQMLLFNGYFCSLHQIQVASHNINLDVVEKVTIIKNTLFERLSSHVLEMAVEVEMIYCIPVLISGHIDLAMIAHSKCPLNLCVSYI